MIYIGQGEIFQIPLIFFLLNVNFEILTIRFHVLYFLNKHVKFRLNRYYLLFNQ